MTPTVQPAGDVPRVALLTNAPAPYRTEFLNDLASRCHLLVVFDTEREPDREWMIDTSDFRFDWVVSRGLMVSRPLVRQRRFERRVLHVPVNTLGILERFRPDIVVSGELGVRTMWAALSCLRRSRHLIVWWEGVPNTDGSGRLRTLRRTMLLRRASRVWATGLESARSLASYDVSRERVDLGMTAIDTLWWRGAVDEQRAMGARRRATSSLFGVRYCSSSDDSIAVRAYRSCSPPSPHSTSSTMSRPGASSSSDRDRWAPM